ncbi:hypothetical protein LCGC14_2393670, partial [marine sediment metagenome]
CKCSGMVKKNSDGNQKTPEERTEILKKYRETCLENFGVDSFPKTEQWSTKTIETNLERYGFANSFSNPDARAKQQQTMIERYGERFAVQVPELNEKRLNTLEERHGVRNPGYLNSDDPSAESQEWLDYLGVPIEQREWPIPNTPYVADAYDPETNIIYEYNGDFYHGGPVFKHCLTEKNFDGGKTFGQLYAITKGREAKLRSLGYDMIIIWGSKWYELRKRSSIRRN